MGRRNRNKKKNNTLKNACTEKKPILLDEQNDTRRKEKEQKNLSYFNHNSKLLVSGSNVGKNCQKLEWDKTSGIKHQSPSDNISENSTLCTYKKVTPYTEEVDKIYSTSSNMNGQISNMYGARAKYRSSNFHQSEEQYESHFDAGSLRNISDSDDEYASSDFYTSSHINGQVSTTYGARAKDRSWTGSNFESKRVGSNFHQSEGQYESHFDSGYLHNISDSDDEYASSDFYRSSFHNHTKEKNTHHKFNSEAMEVKNNFYSSIDEYKSSKNTFSEIYNKWLPERKSTLQKLQSLSEEVRSAQVRYNDAQAWMKEFSFMSRAVMNETDSFATNFLASIAAFATDSVSGITSLAQAFNVDSFQTKFQEIMDHDAEITKDLYTTRSQCVAKYEGVEEVMRKFHADTFSSTVNKISSSLEVNKYWESMMTAYKKDNMSELMDTVSNFFSNACQVQVLEEIGSSINKYVNDNPAALEACKSTTKAVYGAVHTWGPKFPRNSAMGKIHRAANFQLMLEDKKDAAHLRSVVDRNSCENKLQIQIEDAIDSLQSEMEEIRDIYCELFQNEIYSITYDSE